MHKIHVKKGEKNSHWMLASLLTTPKFKLCIISALFHLKHYNRCNLKKRHWALSVASARGFKNMLQFREYPCLQPKPAYLKKEKNNATVRSTDSTLSSLNIPTLHRLWLWLWLSQQDKWIKVPTNVFSGSQWTVIIWSRLQWYLLKKNPYRCKMQPSDVLSNDHRLTWTLKLKS